LTGTVSIESPQSTQTQDVHFEHEASLKGLKQDDRAMLVKHRREIERIKDESVWFSIKARMWGIVLVIGFWVLPLA
jgi:hypothetical protein